MSKIVVSFCDPIWRGITQFYISIEKDFHDKWNNKLMEKMDNNNKNSSLICV